MNLCDDILWWIIYEFLQPGVNNIIARWHFIVFKCSDFATFLTRWLQPSPFELCLRHWIVQHAIVYRWNDLHNWSQLNQYENVLTWTEIIIHIGGLRPERIVGHLNISIYTQHINDISMHSRAEESTSNDILWVFEIQLMGLWTTSCVRTGSGVTNMVSSN